MTGAVRGKQKNPREICQEESKALAVTFDMAGSPCTRLAQGSSDCCDMAHGRSDVFAGGHISLC